jgi:hypothetical protein
MRASRDAEFLPKHILSGCNQPGRMCLCAVNATEACVSGLTLGSALASQQKFGVEREEILRAADTAKSETPD